MHAIAMFGCAAATLMLALGSPAMAQQQHPAIDPAIRTFKLPDQLKWTGSNRPGSTVQNAVLVGDPAKPGFYMVLNKRGPNDFSPAHWHPNTRYIMVIKGTWWIGTGPKVDPDKAVPMPPGSFVVDISKQVHWDGTKDEESIILAVGEGPNALITGEPPK
jgi:hypothetical protein